MDAYLDGSSAAPLAPRVKRLMVAAVAGSHRTKRPSSRRCEGEPGRSGGTRRAGSQAGCLTSGRAWSLGHGQRRRQRLGATIELEIVQHVDDQ